MKRKRKQRIDIDPTWLQETVNDLLEQGCDEEFIQCCIDDLKEGHQVTVEFTNTEYWKDKP